MPIYETKNSKISKEAKSQLEGQKGKIKAKQCSVCTTASTLPLFYLYTLKER
jgi:hypothetical protein